MTRAAVAVEPALLIPRADAGVVSNGTARKCATHPWLRFPIPRALHQLRSLKMSRVIARFFIMRAISPPAEPPGLEQRIWKRLPATLLVGTLVPLGLSMINRVSTPVTWSAGGGESLLLLWDYTMIGLVMVPGPWWWGHYWP
jgi:hypothetical protein